MPGLWVQQKPPDFLPAPRGAIGLQTQNNEILLGRLYSGDTASLPLESFLKHGLITGFTGSGKTNTVLFLLDQFWRDHHKPFLVIESSKTEYRGLIAVKDFAGFNSRTGEPLTRVYTLGNEMCAPFRLNPFELFPKVRLEAHISRLQACFESCLPREGPLPSLVSDALLLIYEEAGWKLTDAGPEHSGHRRFPQLKDLAAKIEQLLENRSSTNPKGRGYQGELLQNVRGFVAGRISPLLSGSKGMMFDVQQSIPPEVLFGHPTILELNDLNEGDKSLVMMFLLTMLREYRETRRTRKLEHITVVEEAHNDLS